MKQTILDLLKTKFEGVDESILSRIADTKAARAVKTEDEAKTYVDGVTLNHILTSYGDMRATEAQRTAIGNYEKKHGLKDGNKIKEGEPTPPQDTPTDDMPAWAKALMESNHKLAEQVAGINADKIAASRKQQLDAIINKLPERDRKGYARTAYKGLSDEEFTALLEEIEAEVDETIKSDKITGTTFGMPQFRRQGNDPNKKEATKEEVEAVIANF